MYPSLKYRGFTVCTFFLCGFPVKGLWEDAAESVKCTAVKPQPAGCGLAGHLSYEAAPIYAVGSPQIVDSVEDCAVLCARRISSSQNDRLARAYTEYEGYCSSFEYDTISKLCQLGMLNVTENVRPAASHTVFYNDNCFTCGKFCAQPYGEQLLDNGNFEQPLLGPWLAQSAHIVKGYHSNRAYRCIPAQYTECILTQSINMCMRETYVVQFDYVPLVAPSASTTTLQLVFGGPLFKEFPGGGYFEYMTQSSNTDPHAWNTVRAYFTYLSGEHIGPYYYFTDGGASIDNVYVARVPSNPSLKPSAKSVVKNGGFETNRFAPWTTESYAGFDGMFYIVSPGIDSEYGLFFNATSFYTFPSPYLVQTVTTKPKTTYLVSYKVRIYHQPFDLTLYVGPDNEQFIYERNFLPGNHSFSAVVTAPTNETRIRLEFADVQAVTSGSILVDDIAMVEIEKSKYYP